MDRVEWVEGWRDAKQFKSYTDAQNFYAEVQPSQRSRVQVEITIVGNGCYVLKRELNLNGVVIPQYLRRRKKYNHWTKARQQNLLLLLLIILFLLVPALVELLLPLTFSR
jgi:hypothetical protein